MDCNEIYETGLLYHRSANTSYPLTPQSFLQYKKRDEMEIRHLAKKDWQLVDSLCLYVHVPFCKTHCNFCQYVVIDNADENTQNEYVSLLLREMDMYVRIIGNKPIVGYDLGGGTPTMLSIENLRKITDAVTDKFNIQPGVVFSVETTPQIAAQEPEKLQALYEMGYRRISMGIQTISEDLLKEMSRDGSISIYERAVENIRAAGFRRLNIDLMCGLPYQTDRDFDQTLQYVIDLKPEYITLNRSRGKIPRTERESGNTANYKAAFQYRVAHRMLNEYGYAANPGKNIFSRIPQDEGTSDYMTNRIINGTPYLGLGLGAQTFAMHYLSYNMGASDKRLDHYREAIESDVLPLQDVYDLTQEECMAKMIAVSFNFGFVDLNGFFRRFNIDFCHYFRRQLSFLEDNELIEQKGDRIYLTERGADFINGVIPLFYSKYAQEELKTLYKKQLTQAKQMEERTLSAYQSNDTEHPVVMTNVAAFAMHYEASESYRHMPVGTLSVLLVKRSENPFINRWALPGTFLKKGETLESCAERELLTDIHLQAKSFHPFAAFSEPDRDPRGWIISNAFYAIVHEDEARVMSGDDSFEARWFDIEFRKINKEEYELKLFDWDITLKTRLKVNGTRYGHMDFTVIGESDLAFDHARILACALMVMRDRARNFELVFDFIPERFTLSNLQNVQEVVTREKTVPANFRRKIAEYVEETEEYEEGFGHRPAKLFVQRKKH